MIQILKAAVEVLAEERQGPVKVMEQLPVEAVCGQQLRFDRLGTQ